MTKPKAGKPPQRPPDLSEFQDPWCVYATEAQATHAIESIDGSHGYPVHGHYAHDPDGPLATDAQPTVTWAELREIAPGGWAFPAPPQEHLPSDPGEIMEYDPAWFPPPEPP